MSEVAVPDSPEVIPYASPRPRPSAAWPTQGIVNTAWAAILLAGLTELVLLVCVSTQGPLALLLVAPFFLVQVVVLFLLAAGLLFQWFTRGEGERINRRSVLVVLATFAGGLVPIGTVLLMSRVAGPGGW